jgi:hypothetical protein
LAVTSAVAQAIEATQPSAVSQSSGVSEIPDHLQSQRTDFVPTPPNILDVPTNVSPTLDEVVNQDMDLDLPTTNPRRSKRKRLMHKEYEVEKIVGHGKKKVCIYCVYSFYSNSYNIGCYVLVYQMD